MLLHSCTQVKVKNALLLLSNHYGYDRANWIHVHYIICTYVRTSLVQAQRADVTYAPSFTHAIFTEFKSKKSLLTDLQGRVCSDVLADPHYRDMVASYLGTWHKFVPYPHQLDSNCWSSQNSMPSLPRDLQQRMLQVGRFIDIPTTFNESEIALTLAKMQNVTMPPTRSNTTGTHFCLPTSYLMGISKSGTTLLYWYIREHPLMASPVYKEGQFWREFVALPKASQREFEVLLYLYHYFNASQRAQEDPDVFTVDASGSTIFATSYPLRTVEKDICVVPLLLSLTLPKVKLMVIMRNPVDRLWSDFWYFCSRENWKTGSGKRNYSVPEHVLPVASEIFHNSTVAAIQDFVRCIMSGHTQFHCTTLAGSFPGPRDACKTIRLGLSMYYIHLVKWFSVFPHDQILPLKFEKLISEPSKTMERVWQFLGVPGPEVAPIERNINENKWIISSKYSEYFKMWPETRDLLREFFEPYNEALAELLDDQEYTWIWT